MNSHLSLVVLVVAVVGSWGCGSSASPASPSPAIVSPAADPTVDGPGTPGITIASVPPMGAWPGSLSGRVTHVVPADYRVVVYLTIGGTAVWGPKPTWDSPYTAISSTGEWTTNVTTGGVDQYATDYVAYLVKAGFTPPEAHGETRAILATIEQAAVAKAVATR